MLGLFNVPLTCLRWSPTESCLMMLYLGPSALAADIDDGGDPTDIFDFDIRNASTKAQSGPVCSGAKAFAPGSDDIGGLQGQGDDERGCPDCVTVFVHLHVVCPVSSAVGRAVRHNLV
ncbi:MAG: hypothetical protein WBH39_05730 [Candidatus Microthrix parvicella]